MSEQDMHTFGSCRVRVSSRQAVLFVDLTGSLASVELDGLSDWIARMARREKTARLLVDARGLVELDSALRDALTAWAMAHASPVVLVVGDELQVAEINMASLAKGAAVRAFASSSEAFRHLARSPSRMGLEAVDGSARGSQPPLGDAQRRALLFGEREAGAPSRLRPPRAGEPS